MGIASLNAILRKAVPACGVGAADQALGAVRSFSLRPRSHSKVSGRLLKVMAWYDNEWGFSNRMLDNALALWRAPA